MESLSRSPQPSPRCAKSLNFLFIVFLATFALISLCPGSAAAQVSHTITASAGNNGSISPTGAVSVADGGSQYFAISAYPYYRILDVLVDGVSQGPSTSSYDFINVLADHTITAYFANSADYVIWATAGPGGTISPYGGVDAPYGTSHTFNIAANAGYQIADVLVNGASVGAVSSYSFTYPGWIGDQTIKALFAPIVHTITATAGPGGSISPAGTVSVADGNNQTFNFYPNTGYQVVDVVVDGATHLGSVPSYTFTGVTGNHTIAVSFGLIPCTITASAGPGGSILPSGTVTLAYGTSQTFNITPNTGYHISDVQVDGSSVGAVSSYTFNNVTANHTISASFTINNYTITASAGPGGSISPAGAVLVNYGGSQTFSIIPIAGCYVNNVVVDGVSVGAVNSYTFSNVTANHSITASFTASTNTITASAGGGGTISPSGTVSVYYGGSQRFNIIPNPGYRVADVLVDGSSVGSRITYNFTNVTANHNISASFAISLAFPLRGYTPISAPVSAVMDNSVLERTPIQFYQNTNTVIKAFNGETGEYQYGYTFMDPYHAYWLAYKNSSGTDFFPAATSVGVRPLNYINGPYLSYAGMPGYNYQVPEGTPVVATANGTLYQAVTDPVNGAGYSIYQNSYINHGNGWYSWYLYAPLNADILAQISQHGYAQVTKGQVIGQTLGDHLHFEVRYNGFDHQNVVDPYKLELWRLPLGRGINPGIGLLFQNQGSLASPGLGPQGQEEKDPKAK